MPLHLVVAPPARPLVGSVPLPPDREIAELLLLLAGLAEGPSEIRGLARGGESAGAMSAALATLGVPLEDEGGTTRVRGVSLFGLTAPAGPVDCRDSPRALRLLAAVLAAYPFQAVLTGGPETSRASVALLADAVRRRGGVLEGTFAPGAIGEVTPPVVVGPMSTRRQLSEIEYELAEPSPGVKEGLLLTGLYADGPTYVRERIVSRDHAERALEALGVPVARAGAVVQLEIERWDAKLPAFSVDLPGDPAAAALLAGAAALVEGSRVEARGACLNPTRTGGLELLRQMGGSVEMEARTFTLGESVGLVRAAHAPLRGATLGGELFAHGCDDWPVLAALAARACGSSELTGLAALLGPRDAPSVLARFASMLRAFGVAAEPTTDGLSIEGRPEGALRAADVDSAGDARLAAAATLLGLTGDGPTRVRDAGALALRFPRIAGTLRALGADVRAET